MIQFLRDKTTSIVTKIFLLLLAVSFSLWGIEGVFNRMANDPVALTVGDQEVRLQQVAAEYQRTLDYVRRQSGTELNPMLRRVILEQTLAQFTQQLASAQLAEDLDLPVARATLRREIAAMPVFQNEAGQFDPTQFQLVLRQVGLSEEMLLERVAAEHATRNLWQAVLDGVPTPAPLVEAVARQATVERQLAFVRLPIDPARATATEGALKTYHKDNVQAFMTEEQRTVDVLHVDPAALAKSIQISEADAQAYYAKHQQDFGVQEQRTVTQLVLPSRADADTALALAQGGKPLAAIPSELKQARFVDLGTVKRGDLLKELAEPAFTAAQGKVVGPVESSLGWHLLQVTAITPGTTRTFADARSEIERSLAGAKAYEQAVGIVNTIEDAVFAGESLQQAASEHGLKIVTLTGMTITPQTDEPPLLRDNPKLLQDIFKAPIHEPASFAEIQDGSMVTFTVTAITPPRAKTFAESRAAVEEAYRKTQAETAATQRAAAISKAVGKGAPLEKAAEGLTIETTAFTGRAGTVDGLPEGALDKVFQAPIGQAVMDTADDAVIVAVAVAERQRPGLTAEDTTQAKAAATQAVQESLQSEFNTALQGALQQRHEIKRNEKALARLLSE
jgi:peptidyl-prolyl cis-trans isomerase D